jgi:uncharacterized membrane protein YfcA
MPDLALWQWLLLVLGAVLVGYSKTAINGVGAIAVVLFAVALPARQSTGTLLPLLLCADLTAIWAYRRHANWGLILRLMPWIVAGIVVGAVFVARVDDHVMRVSIGVLLLVLLAVQLWDRRRPRAERPPVPHHILGPAAGTATGFASMVANAAGPITTLYLLASGFGVVALVGAAAWLYFTINLVKLPFSIGLGLVHLGSLALDLVLLAPMLLGAWVGITTIGRISQVQFERYVLVLVAVSALLLLI